MGKLLSVSSLIFATGILFAVQGQTETWHRVYTGSESIIEIDRSSVTFTAINVNHQVDFTAAETARVKFRTVFSKPQLLDQRSGLSYKTSLETYEFRCAKDSEVIESENSPAISHLKAVEYRLYAATFLGADDKMVRQGKAATDWKPIKSGTVTEKLGEAACILIEEKKRTP
ncbi:MAG TPA: hypothetical protein VE961_05750 [Pyrinomonadaceae bacterium]|nr:hypothetical protein [Pyrinomonadaceae bacterium]